MLDELPSTAPLPTLRTRMANERALGLSFIWAAQTRPQLTRIFGEHEARALLGLTNTLVMFGGSKDVAFNQEISDLLGTVRVGRVTTHRRLNGGGGTYSGDDIAILRPEEVRQLPERQALVIAENGKPIIAKLHRCVEGKDRRTPAGRPAARCAHGSPTTAAWSSPPRPAPPPPSSRPAASDSSSTDDYDRDRSHVRDHPTEPGDPHPAPMIYPFPMPGRARSDWPTASSTSRSTAPTTQQNALGNHALLPRPWEPATCGDPGLRHELWQWLEAVVIWLNHDYTWDAQPG